MTDLLAHCVGRSASLWVVSTFGGEVLAISESITRFLGIGSEHIIGRDIWDLGPNLTADGWPELAERIRQQGMVEVEGLSPAADGRLQAMRFRFEATTAPDGRAVVLGHAEPLLVKEGSQQLGDEYWFRCITRYGDDCFWLFDVRNGTVTMNSRWYHQLGLEPQPQQSLQAVQEQLHPDDRIALAPLYGALLAGDVESVATRARLRHRDGHYRWMRHKAHIVARSPSGRPIEILGHDVDITAEVEAEQRALEGERNLRALLDRIPTTVIVYDAHGVPVRWNAAAARSMGVAQDAFPAAIAESLAKGWEMVDETGARIPPGYSPVAQAMSAREPVRDRIIGVDTGQGLRWGLMNVTPGFDADGALVDVVITVADITETRRLEAAVAQAQRLESLGRLAGGVAHDFNNLLTVVASVGEMLAAELPPDTELAADVVELLHAAHRGSQVTRQLLSYARHAPAAPRPVDLGGLLQASSGVLRRLVPVDITLETWVADGLWTVRMDPGQFDQILVNLTVNAVDAIGPEEGRVLLALSNQQRVDSGGAIVHRVRLAVTDTGCGMTTEVAARAVEPFFTTKAIGAGTGLGLSTCFSLARQNGGTLRIHSVPGAGTTIEIDFPRIRSAAMTSTPPGDLEVTGSGEVVLLVEDEGPVRRLVYRALTASGYAVIIAADGHEALRLLEDGAQPRLIITDVALPGLDGADLVEMVRRRRPGMAVLFISGHDDPTLVRHGIDRATVDFLPKPFGPRALVSRVDAMLHRSK